MKYFSFLTLLLACGLAKASIIEYSITPINFNIPLTQVPQVYLNNLGQIAATGQIDPSTIQAMVGTPAGFTTIPMPDGWGSSAAFGFNDLGQVLMTGLNAGPPVTPGTTIVLGTTAGDSSPVPWNQTAAFGLNNLGEVATSNGTQVLFGVPGNMSVLQLPWPSSLVNGLNDLGQMTGYEFDGTTEYAFIASALGTEVLPLPVGWTGATGEKINNAGQVLGGQAAIAPGSFIGTADGVTEIPPPPGANWWFGEGLNDLGQVVGYSDKGAWIWDPAHGTRLLSDLIGGAFVGNDGIAINDNGQILADDGSNYYLLTPIGNEGGGAEVPEIDPSSALSAATLLCGSLFLIRGIRR